MITIRELRELGHNTIADLAIDNQILDGNERDEDDTIGGAFTWMNTSQGQQFWQHIECNEFDEARAIHPHLFDPIPTTVYVTVRELRQRGYDQLADMAISNQVLAGNDPNENLDIQASYANGGFAWCSSPQNSRIWELVHQRDFDRAIEAFPQYFERTNETEQTADPTPPIHRSRPTIQAYRQYPVTMNESYQNNMDAAVDAAIEEVVRATGVPASALGEPAVEKPKKVKVGNNVYGKVVRTTVRKDVLKQFIKRFCLEGGVVTKSKGVTVFKLSKVTVGRFTERKDGRMAGRVTKCVLGNFKNEYHLSIPLVIVGEYPELKPNLSSFFEPSIIQGNLNYIAA